MGVFIGWLVAWVRAVEWNHWSKTTEINLIDLDDDKLGFTKNPIRLFYIYVAQLKHQQNTNLHSICIVIVIL